MNRFELRYDWDDFEQAYYNKTLHHIQHGKMIILKLEKENEEDFIKRCENETRSKLSDIENRKRVMPSITHYEFIKE